MKKEMFEIIFKDISVPMLCVCFIMGAIGLTIKYLRDSANRDIHNPRTPNKFSWKFLISDNARKILLNLLVLTVGVYFFSNIFGSTITLIGAFLFGLTGIDTLLNKWLPSQKTKEDMDLEYVFTVESLSDRITDYDTDSGLDYSLSDFADQYGYTLVGKELRTDRDLLSGENTIMGLINVENVSYIRRPIRRPKEQS
jgi:hypothetical protein